MVEFQDLLVGREFLLKMKMRLKQSLGRMRVLLAFFWLFFHLTMAEECHFSRCEAYLAIHSANPGKEVIVFECFFDGGSRLLVHTNFSHNCKRCTILGHC